MLRETLEGCEWRMWIFHMETPYDAGFAPQLCSQNNEQGREAAGAHAWGFNKIH